MVDLAASVWRDYVTDGVPLSGANKPNKAKIREWGAAIERLQSGSSFAFSFSSTTADSDPGNGIFRFNNASPASATAVYLDNLDASGADIGTIVDTWDDSSNPVRGTLTVRGVTDETLVHTYSVTGSVVNGTGYRKLTVVHAGGSGSFVAGDDYTLTFSRSGDPGTVLGVVAGKGITVDSTDTAHPIIAYSPPVFNVKFYGAVGDGTTNDTAAIQAALDACKAAGGGTVYFPGTSGGYKITSGLTYNVSVLTGRFTSRLRIVGDGAGPSFITLASVAGTALTITGNASFPEMVCHFEGLRLTGNSTVGSKGLVLSKSAFGSSDGLVIEAFDYNLDCTDVEQVQFANSNFRWGIHGARFNAAAGTTSPNSLVFNNCAFSNNTTWGLWITNANAVTFIGGSTQYNGTTGGGSTMWGMKITEAGDGYGNVLFLGHVFEGNGGDSDFISEQSTNVGTFTFKGVGFARPNSTSYATNMVKLDGTQACTYNFEECTLRGYNTYTPNAARPYFAINNGNVLIFDGGSNVYGSATERPGWAGYMRVPAPSIFGAGAVPLGGAGFVARQTTDKNFYVGANFSLSDGVSFGSVDDANTNLKGMEFRADKVLVGAGSFSRKAPVTKTGNFTLAATENWIIVNQAATTTVTLPAASTFSGREIMIKTIQAQLVISASSNVSPMTSATPGTAILAATAGKWATLVSDGTNWIIMAGN